MNNVLIISREEGECSQCKKFNKGKNWLIGFVNPKAYCRLKISFVK